MSIVKNNFYYFIVIMVLCKLWYYVYFLHIVVVSILPSHTILNDFLGDFLEGNGSRGVKNVALIPLSNIFDL